MAIRLRSRWEPQHQGSSRRDRLGGWYEPYVPDPLMGWNPEVPADVVADLADAEAAVRDLNSAGTTHVSLEGLARFLLRAESVGSSRIEGLEAAARRLARAEAALALGGDVEDRIAVEVLGNIQAMTAAVEAASTTASFERADLLEIHRRLMRGSPTPQLGGVVRRDQNWIGGSSFNPCSASFVPPPPELVEGLLDDLLVYINGDDHSPLVQAALAHAQFETIHPFADGNGRTGRALIHVVLKRRGLAPRFVPPISLVLATWAEDYVEGLTRFRHTGARDSAERSAGAVAWLRMFASATSRACSDAQRYSKEIAALDGKRRAQVGRVRARSGTDRLLAILPGAPIVTVESASALIGTSKARTTDAVNKLARAGVLTQRNIGRQRYRVFEASDVLDLFTSLERTLATPTGDTRTDVPTRRVPARRRR